MVFRILVVLIFILPAAGFSSPAPAADGNEKLRYDFSAFQDEEKRDIQGPLATILSTPDFSTFAVALRRAGLADTVRNLKDHTIFLPDNDAFASLPEGELNRLLSPAGQADLSMLLKRHILNRTVKMADSENGDTMLSPMSGQAVALRKKGIDITVGRAHIIKADVPTSGGFIHVIDRVIMAQ